MARTSQCDVLIVLTGAPHSSDLVTTVFRMLSELLDRGRSVRVFACGYATMLTQMGLGDTKPRDLENWERQHPTTLAMIRGLLSDFPDLLCWEACTFCSEDRGAVSHMPQVRRRAPSRIGAHAALANKTVYIGGA